MRTGPIPKRLYPLRWSCLTMSFAFWPEGPRALLATIPTSPTSPNTPSRTSWTTAMIFSSFESSSPDHLKGPQSFFRPSMMDPHPGPHTHLDPYTLSKNIITSSHLWNAGPWHVWPKCSGNTKNTVDHSPYDCPDVLWWRHSLSPTLLPKYTWQLDTSWPSY